MRKQIAGAALAALLLLATGACGDSDSGGSDDTFGLKGEPIKLGNIGTYSGDSAGSHIAAKYAIEAWAKSVNAAGGIDGRPVEVITADDKGDPATGATAVKKLVEQDKVVAIVGEHSTGATGWAPYAAEKNIPVVGGYTNDTSFVGYANWFNTGGNILSDFWAIAEQGAKAGPKMAMLYCAEVPGCKAASTILETFGTPIGLDVSYTAGVAANSSDYTSVCLAMQEAGVQSYNMSVATAVNQRIADQCAALGFKAQLVQVGDTATNLREKQPVYDGTQFVGNSPGFFVDSTPAEKEFQAAMKKYAPDLGSEAVPNAPSSLNSWTAGKLFEAAVKASGSKDITSQTIFDGLYALNGETLGGLAPPLTYTKGQPTLFNFYYPYELQDGKWVQPEGPDPIAADADTAAKIAEMAKGFAPKA